MKTMTIPTILISLGLTIQAAPPPPAPAPSANIKLPEGKQLALRNLQHETDILVNQNDQLDRQKIDIDKKLNDKRKELMDMVLQVQEEFKCTIVSDKLDCQPKAPKAPPEPPKDGKK